MKRKRLQLRRCAWRSCTLDQSLQETIKSSRASFMKQKTSGASIVHGGDNACLGLRMSMRSIIPFCFLFLITATSVKAQSVHDPVKFLAAAQMQTFGLHSYHLEGTITSGSTVSHFSADIAGDEYDILMAPELRARCVKDMYWVSDSNGTTWRPTGNDRALYWTLLRSLSLIPKHGQRAVSEQQRSASGDPTFLIQLEPAEKSGNVSQYWVRSLPSGEHYIERFKGTVTFLGSPVQMDETFSNINSTPLILAPDSPSGVNSSAQTPTVASVSLPYVARNEDCEQLVVKSRQATQKGGYHVDLILSAFDGNTLISGDVVGKDYDLVVNKSIRLKGVGGAYWVSVDQGKHWRKSTDKDLMFYDYATSGMNDDQIGKEENGVVTVVKSKYVIIQQKKEPDGSGLTVLEQRADPLPAIQESWPRYWIMTDESNGSWIQRFAGNVSDMYCNAEYTKLGKDLKIVPPSSN